MNYEINWDALNKLPKKKREEFTNAIREATLQATIERIKKEEKEKEGMIFAYIIGFFVLFSLGIAGILWLLTLVFSFVTFNWIFVGIVSAILAIIVGMTIDE